MGDICVRTVRSGPTIGFQWVGADGRAAAPALYRPPDRPHRWLAVRKASREAVGRIGFQQARTMRTVRTVASRCFLARQKAVLW